MEVGKILEVGDRLELEATVPLPSPPLSVSSCFNIGDE